MANYPPPPGAAYWSLMTCQLVVLDKYQGVCTMGIREMLLWDLDKLLLKADGDQSKTACGNIQLCFRLKASIGGSAQAVGHWRIYRLKVEDNIAEVEEVCEEK